MSYSFKEVEAKWQANWEKNPYFAAKDGNKGKKFYCLDMFPYPSGSGLHVGHWKGYVFSDVYARMKFLEGYNVLHPMGFDSFGLPAENDAIKKKIKPKIGTQSNIDNFRSQLKTIGAMYDWSKELSTTDPEYYKWTQWIFLKMFEKGLAYEANMPINWCPKCLTGLANEESKDGICDRCGSTTEQKPVRQWVLKITEYADRLTDDLDGLDWSEKVKAMQRNWIGRSHGLVFTAPVKDTNLTIETFSAHFEAFAADTFVVIAPGHERLPELLDGVPNKDEILSFCKKILLERQHNGNEEIEPEGIFTGRYIVDPIGNGDLPIWVANFALAHYGTGIVKCSAHDERDFAFAKKYNIALKAVLFPQDPELAQKVKKHEVCYTDMQEGVLSEPLQFAGKRAGDVRQEIIEYCEQQGLAQKKVAYKLRDWIFSRQRYWGEPIPLVHCASCGIIPVPESELPIILPDVEEYEPTGTGESPLAAIDWWVNTTCPKCSGPGKRETNTMPQWAGSCWYFLRYLNPKLEDKPFDADDVKYWMPVDLYVGGIEHAVLHLLYARFYVKFLYDIGALPFNEPFAKLFNQGMVCMKSEITGRVEKMSKSKGNVVDPDEIVQMYGADTLRMYTLFMGPPELDNEWNSDSIRGVHNFLGRLYTYLSVPGSILPEGQRADISMQRRFAQFLKDYQYRLSTYRVNTAVASLMEFYNDAHAGKMKLDRTIVRDLLTSISVMAPYYASELLETLAGVQLEHCQWPTFDESLAQEDTIAIPVQVNGKLRATLNVDRNASREDIEKMAQGSVAKWLEGKDIARLVFIPGRLVNFVVN